MDKLKFKTSFDIDDVKVDCSSTKVNEYKLCVDEKGHEFLTKVGEHDFQEEIDSYLPDTDINLLLARFMRGDTSAIRSPFDCQYGDNTDFDCSLNQINEKLNSACADLLANKDYQEYIKTNPEGSFSNFIDGFSKFVQEKNKAVDGQNDKKEEGGK